MECRAEGVTTTDIYPLVFPPPLDIHHFLLRHSLISRQAEAEVRMPAAPFSRLALAAALIGTL